MMISRVSPSEWSGSSKMRANGSAKTVSASSKATRCFFRFSLALAGSHSNSKLMPRMRGYHERDATHREFRLRTRRTKVRVVSPIHHREGAGAADWAVRRRRVTATCSDPQSVPDLEAADIREALRFAAEAVRERDLPLPSDS